MSEFDTWLSENGFDPAAIGEKQKLKLQAAWRAEQGGGGGTATAVADDPPRRPASTFTQTADAIAAEGQRVEAINRMAGDAMTKYARLGDTAKVDQIRRLAEAAIEDEKVDVRAFKHELIIAGRADTVSTFQRSEPAATDKVIEAAVCRRAGMSNLDKLFDVRTLEDSEKQFKSGLSLVGLLHQSAQRNGWRGMPDPNSRDFLRAAFGQQGGGGNEMYDIRAGTTGPSTFSLPNILGNIANKSLRAGFLGVDSAWSQIAARRSVNNFQTVTGVSINGATIYRTLAPSGEIKHATLTETTYTNRASTYAIMIGIPREALVNDDAGVFTDMSRHIGRGAGLKINDLFWTAFLNNSSFFTAGNNNVSTGGGSALGTADGAAINAAEQKFTAQTGADGYPIAVAPKIMLVPPTLANTARRWMGSFGFTPSGTAGLGDSNIFQGRYSVVTSPYMESAAYTGNSTAAWYLLADPMDVPVIEGVALNGRWEPTVDQAEADFNQLGIALRGFIDVGFALYEFRGGVRSAGS
jgi:hypothetical protein